MGRKTTTGRKKRKLKEEIKNVNRNTIIYLIKIKKREEEEEKK